MRTVLAFGEDWLRDLGFALRTFRRSLGFTVTAVLSLALGIAANATVFTVVSSMLLRDLPVRQPVRLVSFAGSFSYLDYVDYRDQTNEVFEGVAAHFALLPANLSGTGQAERIWGQLVSGNYFSVIGVTPALGRGIMPADDESLGREPVVVLSDALWRRGFASDTGIVGRSIVLNGHPYTIIGVAPQGFQGTDRGLVPAFWAPLSMHEQLQPDFAKFKVSTQREVQWLNIHGRLQEGVSRQQAVAAVNVVRHRLDETHRQDPNRHRVAIALENAGGLTLGGFLGRSTVMRGVRLTAVLMGVAGLVLVIVCANVANLLLARAADRQTEVSIRLAVGAGRARLVRQLLTESMLLAVIGAAAGFGLATVAAGVISQLDLPVPIPIAFDFAPDLRVVAFTAVVAALTAVLFGLLPALRATRPSLASIIKGESAGFAHLRRTGLKNALVALQMALSVVLLIGSGLFLRTLQKASSTDIGMQPANVLLVAVDPGLRDYSPARIRQFVDQLRQRVSPLPGVASMTFLDSVPLGIAGSSRDFKAASVEVGTVETNADVYSVGSGFFETLGIPLLRGRDFNRGAEGVGAAIINQRMAERLFPGVDPIGRRLTDSQNAAYVVVGVAGNTKSRTLTEEPAACAYLPLEGAAANTVGFTGIWIAVKTTVEPRSLARAVRDEVATLEPDLAVFDTGTMSERVSRALLVPRLCATLLTVLGLAGLTLASIGLYGVASCSVSRRTREIGIRMALGASARGVLFLILGQGLIPAGVGLVVGLGLAIALSRFAASWLYGISPTDVFTFTGVSILLLVVSVAATAVPSWRATKTPLAQALRCE